MFPGSRWLQSRLTPSVSSSITEVHTRTGRLIPPDPQAQSPVGVQRGRAGHVGGRDKAAVRCNGGAKARQDCGSGYAWHREGAMVAEAPMLTNSLMGAIKHAPALEQQPFSAYKPAVK